MQSFNLKAHEIPILTELQMRTISNVPITLLYTPENRKS